MRVVHVTECPAGGVLRYLVDLCEALVAYGVEVEVVYSVRPETPPDLASYFSPQVQLHHLQMQRSVAPNSDLRALLRLACLLRRRMPDFVHAHSSKAGFLARWAARLAGIRNVYYTPHAYAFLMTSVPPTVRRLYLALEKLGALAGGITVASSPNELEVARSNGFQPVRKLYHAVRVPATVDDRRPPRQKAPVVGTSGRIAPQKNPWAFLEACAAIAKRLPQATFVWIGDGELRDEFEARARRLGVEVAVTGWLGLAEALDRLSRLDLYLHTALWEAWPPYTVLEAMASGVPVVALQVPGITDDVFGAVELAGDPQAMAEAACRIAGWPPLWRDRVLLGLEVISREFSMEKFRQAVAELYGLK